jgi:hypothetical protein
MKTIAEMRLCADVILQYCNFNEMSNVRLFWEA